MATLNPSCSLAHGPEKYLLLPIGTSTSKRLRGMLWEYWRKQSLKRVWARMCDRPQPPTIEDIKRMTDNPEHHCFGMYDPTRNRIVGECMLEGWTGAAAKAHVSVCESILGEEVLEIGRSGVRQIFNFPGYVKTLIGLVPITNRNALKFVKRIGYKRVGVLKNSSHTYNLKQKVNDLVITQVRAGDEIR